MARRFSGMMLNRTKRFKRGKYRLNRRRRRYRGRSRFR